MVKSIEAKFSTRDGTSLYTKTWTPDSPSCIHLVFIHGFSDHINAYYELVPLLASPPYNITIHGFDQRGWGRSTTGKADHGRTGDTQQVLEDIHDFINFVAESIKDANVQIFLMGHSMGGAESLLYLLTDPSAFKPLPIPISGLLVESPHIGFPPAAQPSSLLVFSGRMAAKVLPNRQMLQKLDSSAMSRNPQVCKDWENDELCHDTGTLRGLAGLLDRANYLNGFGNGSVQVHAGRVKQLPCPVWFGHGTGDQVCDFSSSKTLFEKLVSNNKGSKHADLSKFVPYEGGYHKLHGEPDGMAEQFARDAGDWILSVADSTSPASVGSQTANANVDVAEASQATAGTGHNPEDGGTDMKSRL